MLLGAARRTNFIISLRAVRNKYHLQLLSYPSRIRRDGSAFLERSFRLAFLAQRVEGLLN
jgi:hypothetical protein